MNSAPPVLVGCGILSREIQHLIAKNDWSLDTHFLAASLHNYLDRLDQQLNQALCSVEARGQRSIVFYGVCHPLMDRFIAQHHSQRVAGQNCVAILLGYPRFMQALQDGAYFLLEDWALNWQTTLRATFGANPAVAREIFRGSHRYVLALRTPCSSDFSTDAMAVAEYVDLPLRWETVELTELERTLAEALAYESFGRI